METKIFVLFFIINQLLLYHNLIMNHSPIIYFYYSE
jgi:hypothetical protein